MTTAIEKDLSAMYEAQVRFLEEAKQSPLQGMPIQSLDKELKGKHVQSLTAYDKAITSGEVVFVDPGDESNDPTVTVKYDSPIIKKDDAGYHIYKVGVFTGQAFMKHFQLVP